MDDTAKAWLKTELTALLGFPEVDDIVSYIATSLKTQDEVEPYLTELLGVPAGRAKSIGNRLFGGAAKPAAEKKPAAAASGVRMEPLVPKPAAVNSRIKQAKIKKPSKLVHSRIINCLKCGRIEYEGARRCVFCDEELRYEELDDAMMDPAVQQHMKTLVGYDESSAERTVVYDTEEVFYDEVRVTKDDERHRQPIVLNLNLENRSFETVEAPALVLTANQQLSKDARELLQKMEKQLKANGRGTSASSRLTTAEQGVLIEDEYNALYV